MAVLSLAAAGALYFGEIDGAGFPDGHLTDYERWILPYLWAAVCGLGLLGVGFAALAAVKTRSPVASWIFRAAVLAVLVVTVGVLVVLPRIGVNVLHLEHGQGG